MVLKSIRIGAALLSSAAMMVAAAQAPTARSVLNEGMKTTGLAGADAPAYHLKANYTLYDIRSGKETESGTLEVWSSGSGVWHREYTEKKNSASEWSTSPISQVATKGARLNLNALNMEVAQPLLDPMHLAARYPADLELTGQAGTFSGVVLNCVTVTYPTIAAQGMNPDMLFPRYCFDAKSGVLRYTTTSTVITAFTGFKTVGSRQVATKVQIKPYNRLGEDLEVTMLEPLPAGSDAMLKPAGKTVDFPLAHEPGDPPLVPVHVAECEYPIEARNNQIFGVVSVPVVIEKDGKVKGNGPAMGPYQLSHAAEDCVTNYRFQPYMVNGQPVVVSDAIEYNFDGKPYQGLNGTITIASQSPARK